MLTFDDCVALADGDFASTPVLHEVGTIPALRLIARADVETVARRVPRIGAEPLGGRRDLTP